AEDGIRDYKVTGVQTCALPISLSFGTTWVHLAYHLPRLHAVIDTTIGLVSLLLAYLVYGRVQAFGRQRDAILAVALGFSGIVNQIGRASCRERVYMSVVAVSVK